MRLIDADELRNWIMKNPFANTHDFLDAVYDAPPSRPYKGKRNGTMVVQPVMVQPTCMVISL